MSEYESIVVLSIYNGDDIKFVKESINSIESQDYQDFILCIVLDGPIGSEITDYIENLSRCIVLRNAANKGLAYSLNLAIDYVINNQLNIKYFFRMDADDVCVPNRFSKQVIFLDNNSHVDVLGCNCTEIDEFSNVIGSRIMPELHKEIVNIMPRRCPLNHPTVLFRFNVFNKGFRYDSRLKNTQDYFFWPELVKAGFTFHNLQEKLLCFRRVGDIYKRRGKEKALNDYNARLNSMKLLNRSNLLNILYAKAFLLLRLAPPSVIKLAYNIQSLRNKWLDKIYE